MTENENHVTQTNNTIQGDLAGRDINHFHFPEAKSPLRTLIEQYKLEKERDVQFKEIIEELEHFNKVISPLNIIGLEAKLTLANRAYEVESAETQKEIFVKKMMRNQFYKSAQQIFAYLLGDLQVRYQRVIVPKIQQGMSIEEINKEVLENVLKPVLALLDDNVLDIFPNCVQGMLYFLTGNCHIRWDKNAHLSSSV